MNSDDWRPPFDWRTELEPPKPPELLRWVAAHRKAIRIVLFAVDAALVANVVWGIFTGGVPWYIYLQLVVWAGLTAQYGWHLPRIVDRRHGGKRHSNTEGGPER